jgi:hypothetical protein
MILFKAVTKIFVKDGNSQFQNFCVNFHKFHALFCIRQSITVWPDYYNFGARRVTKMLTNVHKTEIVLALTFSEWHHKEGDEFLSHTVTDDETWILILNAETKEQ